MFLYKIKLKETFIKTTKLDVVIQTKVMHKGFSCMLVCGGFCLILGASVCDCSYIIYLWD